MPELPEVETVVRTLEKQIKDLEILKVEVFYPRMIQMDSAQFKKELIGQHFRVFERRGKYLIFRMDTVTFVSHLRMEGKYYIQEPNLPRNKHMHVIFTLSNGLELRYHDTRKFGTMELYPIKYDFQDFKGLGPEPFSDAFSQAYIHAYRKNRREPLKSLLLDQHFVAGIGNIYADEILASCHLRPGRSCSSLTKKQEEEIVTNTRKILKEAIALGGTTIRSYTSSLGVTGRFQTECSVHMQKVCKRCGSAIKMKYIGGRSSYYCPKCQK